jgi:NADH-quinone oxidoreductase subunit L
LVGVLVDDVMLRWIPAAPLFFAVGVGLTLAVTRRPLSPRLTAALSCTAALAPVALSAVALWKLVFLPDGVDPGEHVVLVDTLYTWVGTGVGPAAFSADLAFRFDALTAVVCLVVTTTGFLVQLYSVGYLAWDHRDDGGIARYFCYLSLLSFSMLLLVLADNLLLLFLGWQGVSVCAYLLISFWYSDADDTRAGSRAFVVNRIGDAGFVVGTLLLFWALSDAGVPAVSFRGIEAGFGEIANLTLAPPAFTGLPAVSLPALIGLAFLLAVVVKMAQVPFHVWLPASALGPPPASASIHAGCGVVAGVYLIVRLSFVYEASPGASATLAFVGVGTALLAGLLACVETDVRKLLAYATVSQAGLMLLAAGAGAVRLAVFHLTLHAFFMTLLFLAIGSLMVALNGEYDLLNMGGLRARLESLWWVTAIGVLTLAGLPPLSAFFSLEQIHAAVLVSDVPANYLAYIGALIAATLSAFLATRLLILVFHGEERVRRRRAEVRAVGDLMKWPMYLLAALSVLGGLVGLPQLFGDAMDVQGSDSLGNFLGRALPASGTVVATGTLVVSMLVTLLCSVFGFASAYTFYVSRPALGLRLHASPLRALLVRGYFMPELYEFLFVRSLRWLSLRVLYERLELSAVERENTGGGFATVSGFVLGSLRQLHSGVVQLYLILAVAGTAALLIYLAGWPR